MRRTQHADAAASRKQRASGGRRIHAAREQRHDDSAAPHYLIRELSAHFQAVRAGLARPDDGDCRLIVQRVQPSLQIYNDRRRENILQALRIVRVLHRHRPYPLPRARG